MDDQKFDHEFHEQHTVNLPQCLVRKIFQNIKEGIMITNAKGEIIEVNAAFEFVTGYNREDVVGKNPKVLQSGIHDRAFYQTMWTSIHTTGSWQGEIWNKRKTNEIYPEWLHILKVVDESNEHTYNCAIFTDLSERKTVEHELEKRKLTDSLTDVSNRFAFLKRLEALLEASTTLENMYHAVYFIDLDRFKHLNETLGHSNGDILLTEIAKRLRTCLRNKDIVARYGADEFVLAITNLQNLDDATFFAQKMTELIEEPIYIQDHEIFVTASIGISLYPSQGVTAEDLVHRAEKAMDFAKRQTTEKSMLYFDDLNIDSSRVLLLDAEIRKAIEQKAFDVYYQPKIDTKTEKILGFEALARWNNEVLGFVSPAEFIPYAEETGLIVPISEVILEKVFEDSKRFAELSLPRLPIAVNISSLHFQHPNFLESIKGMLGRAQTDASFFEIEVTERTVMNNANETVEKFNELRELGFTLSIDDFGTGYSSLSYLVRFPLDTLKIDRSFIQQICHQEEKQAVVDAIIHMSHRLNMRVVAEGVEQQDQVQLLRTLDCDEIQGFYYSKPLPFDEAVGFMQASLQNK